MPIISVEIMKTIDERNAKQEKCKKQQKKNKQRQKRARETEATVKGWALNDFAVHLSFFQLICQASLIFKLNLELASSVFLK